MSNRGLGMPDRDFEQWLEQELNRKLSPMTPLRQRPGQARYQAVMLRNRRNKMTFMLPTAAAAKAVAALAAATVTVSAAGAIAAAAVTGSPNPQVWGQQVKAEVQTCKDALTMGQHGIGACVSAFASKHGQTERTDHANANGQTNGFGAHPGQSAGSAGSTGQSNSATHPTGRP